MRSSYPRLALVLSAAGLAAAAVPSLRAQEVTDEIATAEAHYKDQLVPFLSKNCYVCHGDTRKSGDLNLARYTSVASLNEDRDEWQLVRERIENGEMPPTDMPAKSIPPGGLPNPSQEDRQAAIKWIQAEFDRADRAIKPTAGYVAARFLMGAEWWPAQQCKADRLALDVFPDDGFLARVMAFAEAMAQLPMASLLATKELLVGPHREAMHRANQAENEALGRLSGGPANLEAVAAFREKRAADFSKL